jgi:two-component system sensor histidine kinase ArlS
MKLRAKVVAINVIIMISILLVSGFIVLKTVDNFNLYSMYQNLSSQSNLCEQYLTEYLNPISNPGKTLQEQTLNLEDLLKTNLGCDVEINVFNIKKPTELQRSALSGKKVYLIDTKGSTRNFYLSFPIYKGDKIIGCVTLSNPLYQADNIKRALSYTLLVISAIALIILFILSYLFSYRLIKPLEKLTDATKEFAKGDFKEIDYIKTGDEIEGLATAFNEMGQDIKEIIEDLRSEQKKQKKFLDNVTHEIRTPLTNIMGYADLINRIDDEPQKERYLTYITSESDRLLAMINALLELSRLNTYEQAVIKYEINLKTLIEQAILLMNDRAKKFGVTINLELEDIVASLDSEKIKQVIINLIDNAIKHSEGDLISIRLYKEDKIYITVSDNGIGISETCAENVFEPFYRVDKSRSRKLGGSGLGLSICKEIMIAHGGNIKLESKENLGTTVTISLQP